MENVLAIVKKLEQEHQYFKVILEKIYQHNLKLSRENKNLKEEVDLLKKIYAKNQSNL